MTSITVQLDDDVVEALRRLAVAQQRSEGDIARDILTAYTTTARPLPKGMGRYHSGQTDVAARARDIVREAIKEGHRIFTVDQRHFRALQPRGAGHYTLLPADRE